MPRSTLYCCKWANISLVWPGPETCRPDLVFVAALRFRACDCVLGWLVGRCWGASWGAEDFLEATSWADFLPVSWASCTEVYQHDGEIRWGGFLYNNNFMTGKQNVQKKYVHIDRLQPSMILITLTWLANPQRFWWIAINYGFHIEKNRIGGNADVSSAAPKTQLAWQPSRFWSSRINTENSNSQKCLDV